MSTNGVGESLDLDDLWKEAQDEFQKIFKKDPKKVPVLSAKDVIGKIDQKKESDEKQGAKYRKARIVLQKTLTCIQTLGNLAAQGASMVSYIMPLAMCTFICSY